jgi:molecular chaperone DnaK
MDFVVQQAKVTYPKPGTKYFEELRKQVVSAKKSLSSDSTADVLLDIRDEHSGALITIDETITKKQFDAVVQPFVDRAIECIAGTLQKARITKSSVSRVILVGGTCYIPKVRESVETYFALRAEPGVDPDLAVSQGAAISAGLKTGAVNAATSVIVQDASTFRIGTSAVIDVGNQQKVMFNELMPANAKIPFVTTKRYWLLSADQDSVEVDVLLDPSSKAVFPEDAVPTGAVGEITDIPPSPTGAPWAVDVEFQYDENHIVRVQAKIVGLNKVLNLQLNRPDFVATSGLAEAQMSAVNNLWESSPQAARNNALISRSEKFAEDNPMYAEKLEAMVGTLKICIQSDDESAVRVARGALAEYLASIQ